MKKVEKEILSITQEECAEVTQVISKIFRFGWDSSHPNLSQNNKERLEEELGDLICMIGIMIDKGYVICNNIEVACYNKRKKLKEWSSIFD
jgi:NTP pyrophosphatase (non-canonical NTP hydrolase)